MHLRSPLLLLLLLAPAALRAQNPSEPVSVERTRPRPALRDSACLVPAYPALLREAGIEGQAVVGFVVDTSGAIEPGSARVLTTTHPMIEGPARAAVLRCSFSPGRVAGRAVRVRMQLALNFLLPAVLRPN
jgi:TonB family protein